MNLRRCAYATCGCIALALGAVGAVLPLLPAFPFLLLTAFCFARASERLSQWFLGTKLYKENLEGHVSGQGMTRAAKVRLMAVVTVLMSIGFALMHQVPVGRIILVCVWVFHLAYFTLGVKERRA